MSFFQLRLFVMISNTQTEKFSNSNGPLSSAFALKHEMVNFRLIVEGESLAQGNKVLL